MKITISLLTVIFLLSVCKKNSKEIERVEINPATAKILRFEYFQMKARIIYDDGSIDTTKSFIWSTGDSLIAKVDSNGLVQGLVPGQVSVLASYEKYTDVVIITILENKLLEGSWIFSAIENTQDGTIQNFPDTIPKKLNMQFRIDSLNLNDSIGLIMSFSDLCNTGGGKCLIFENKISFPDGISSTKILCLNSITWENYFLENLALAYEYYFAQDQLILKTRGTYNLYFKYKSN